MDSKLGIDQLNGHSDGDICLAMGKIGAVIVTYNRLNDLKLVLQAYDDMITPPSFLVVVDNASASDTAGFLAPPFIFWLPLRSLTMVRTQRKPM